MTIVLALFLTAAGTVFVWEFLLGPRAVFRRLVICPIPRSVRNIDVDRCQISTLAARLHDGYESHAFILRFNVGKDDIARIIASCGFKPCEGFTYSNGQLEYTRVQENRVRMDGGVEFGVTERFPRGIALYGEWYPEPGWFDLAKWDVYDAYLAGQDDILRGWEDVTFLIYNEQLDSACVIKYELSGL